VADEEIDTGFCRIYAGCAGAQCLVELACGGGRWVFPLAGRAAGVVTVRPAAVAKSGMPMLMAALRRLAIWFIWASLSRAPARLTFRPSASPSQWFASASAMRAVRLSQICTSRGCWPGSGLRSGQRRSR